MLFEKLKKLIGRRYYPLNRIEVSRKKLTANYRRLSSINKNIKVAPVLKSNAYGHGLVETARILDPLRAPFLSVDSLYEAYELYNAKIKSKILIMGYVNPENLTIKKLPFSYAVYEANQLKKIVEYQPEAKIHIFVDTGMHREGVLIDYLETFIKNIPPDILHNVEGLMSHFADSQDSGRPETGKQVENFKKAIEIFNKNRIFPKWRHIANSSGLLNSRVLGLGKISNVARVGIGLYDSVLRFITHVIQIKNIKKGDKVGYDFTYTAKKDSTIAVLPAGYNDGVDRELSNSGIVNIKGASYPIVGRVSMNITTVDLLGSTHIKVGDEAEINFLPKKTKKIPYEFYVHLNPLIKRVII